MTHAEKLNAGEMRFRVSPRDRERLLTLAAAKETSASDVVRHLIAKEFQRFEMQIAKSGKRNPKRKSVG